MKFTPHLYQKHAIEFAKNTPRCGLFLDCGLGKTAITLQVISDLFDDFAVNKVLIIAPRLVAVNTWPEEIKKWDFSAGLSFAVAVGTAKERRMAISANRQITCINRENVVWLCNELGPAWDYDMVVIDESSSFKDQSSKRFKALRRVIPSCSRVIELTGTPCPKSIEDLWAQMYLLDMGERLGRSMSAFRREFERPGHRISAYTWTWEPQKDAKERIESKISDVCMSMRAEDWLDVPELITVDHSVQLPSSIARRYNDFERDLVLDMVAGGDPIIAANAGVLTGKLAQFASGAVYTQEGESVEDIHSLKIDALTEILESCNGNVLIFYWFRFDRDRIKALLGDECREVTGPCDITDWNSGKIKYLLAQPASIGYGLNMQAGGNTIVWYGLTWSSEIYKQASDRLHRQGQKNTVVAHRIVVRGTVDEDMLSALERKERDQNAVLEALKARIKKFTNS